ncbi:MAG: shikimate dehydrogenase [Anaerolineae bacterium]|nr:shikimate dehydrogenase [Anaerolineae bacterium]NIN93854.1 shikimate dehydrogenase [Anaerolineae bacterium]NIQ76889.1 shikimate dehydrogenase [Anaerolineae bacterium]
MTTRANPLEPRTVPTLYFIGVTTTQSSIMKVFPRWSDILGLGAEIVGYDAPIHAPDENYEAIVRHIKEDTLAMGALVTTHKIDLLDVTREMFDYLDPYAELCGEISCISKCDGRLEGYAKDPITSGLAWEAFVEPGHWGRTGAHVMCIGAGGSAVAISVYVSGLPDPADRPPRFVVVQRSLPRLEKLQAIHAKLNTDIEFEYILNEDPPRNDEIMASLPPGSMVINATGMGKDRPGSPVTDNGLFPENGLVWELNYRGELDFMHQAQRQAQSRNLTVEDGWVYFLHGWSEVIAEVFHLDLTPELFAELDKAAAVIR